MGALRNIVLGVLLAGWCVSASPALADKRVALVIGNGSYDRVSRLGNPGNDASLIAETLKGAGFDSVDLERDLKVSDMRRALRDFVDKAGDADVAVVYYAGHGIEVDGVNYLLPVDAVLDHDRDIYDEAVSLERVLVAVEPARKLRLVILDACRDNPFTRSMKRTFATRAVGRGLARVEPTSPNTLIAFASKAGSTASDGDGRNSPFATAFVHHITRPGLDLRKAFGYVRDDVLKSTRNRQEPYLYGSLGGDDLALVPAEPGTAGPQADPQTPIRRDYEFALQLGTRDGWEAFMSQHPDGYYANLAKGQLKKIAAEETRAAAVEKARLADEERTRLAAERQKIAALQPPSGPALTQSELATSLQLELRRIGCMSAGATGEWNAASERSLDLFNQHAGAKLDIKTASLEALDAVKAKTGRVCPQTAALQPPSSPALTPSELTTSLQLELRRVGCMSAGATGEWNTASERSLGLFNQHAGARLDIKTASLDALDAVKAKTARVCPLICETGFRVDGDRCVKTSQPRKPLATREGSIGKDEQRKQTEGSPAKPQASRQIVCGSGGCRPVAKGCRLAPRSGFTAGGMPQVGGSTVEVCD